MKNAIYGAGSLGTVLGAFITKNGGDIDLINHNEAHVKALKESGAQIVGKVEFTQPVKALLINEMTEKYDIIFLMTKQQLNKTVVNYLKDYLKDDGVLVTFQNGLPEVLIGNILGKDRVLGATVAWGATLIKPGVVKLTSDPSALTFTLGSLEKTPNKKINDVKNLLELMGPAEIDDNFVGARWTKLLINSSFSGLGTTLNYTFGDVCKDKKARHIVQLLMKECLDVAKAKGIELSPVQGKDVRKVFDYNNKFKKWLGFQIIPIAMKKHYAIRPSLIYDLERGKTTEVDFINGSVVSAGKECGVPTPMNAKVVKLVHLIEDGTVSAHKDNVKYFVNI
ncbi:MAG: ketopantoate reductase family protein [Bacilli bacterium]